MTGQPTWISLTQHGGIEEHARNKSTSAVSISNRQPRRKIATDEALQRSIKEVGEVHQRCVAVMLESQQRHIAVMIEHQQRCEDEVMELLHRCQAELTEE
jgi:flagellar biosynthesis/type III secretory pathway M-ring protein FliF/YscJ